MRILLLSTESDVAAVLPSLALLPHDVRLHRPDVHVFLEEENVDVVLIDARVELAEARSLCRVIAASAAYPVVPILTEGGLIALSPDWKVADLLLTTTGPAEVEARLRMVLARAQEADQGVADGLITLGDLVIDENTYVARLKGRSLDLAYKEFELLKFLCMHAGRVFTRSQLLQEVWGYDFFGGTRTVDVHVRRLRAKLGSDYESLITTVRNVGYKAVAPVSSRSGVDADSEGVD